MVIRKSYGQLYDDDDVVIRLCGEFELFMSICGFCDEGRAPFFVRPMLCSESKAVRYYLCV